MRTPVSSRSSTDPVAVHVLRSVTHMRVAVMVGLFGAAFATPASACPQGARCIAMVTRPAHFTSVREARPPAPAPRKISLTVRTPSVTVDHLAPLRSSLTSFHPVAIHDGDIEMPYLWAVVASEVESHLPRYHSDESFSMVLSPVVVTMPTESTPGLGLSGDF